MKPFIFSSKKRVASSVYFKSSSIFLFWNSICYLARAYSLPNSSFCFIASSWASKSFFLVLSNFSINYFFSFSSEALLDSKSPFFLSSSSLSLSSLWLIWASYLSLSKLSIWSLSIFWLYSYLCDSKCSNCFSKTEFLPYSRYSILSLLSLTYLSRVSIICYFKLSSCSI